MMRQSSIVLAVLLAHVYSAPQLISFKDGKIGVNFAGYHAAAGLGGLLGDGAAGGLFAEAGTPHGQSARAGLGGAVEGNGRTAGGLYAGATAGGNVKASAGLAGGVSGEKTAGTGYANAQAGDRFASSGLGGEASAEGTSGFTFSGTKSFGVSKGIVKETEIVHQPIHHVEVQPVQKNVDVDVNVEASNKISPLPVHKEEAPATVIVKERPITGYSPQEWQMPPFHSNHFRSPQVYVESPPPPPPPVKVVEKYYHRIKPHRHHLRKTAYIGGYIGGDGGFDVPPPPAPVVYKTVQPVIEKRVDVGVESDVNAGAAVAHGGQVGYTKQVTFQRNPNFFADIFNIPISTLKAVGNFLGNAAGSTSVSVQKTASVQADKDISSKHAPSSSSSSSEAHISVQTPEASKIIDDILAIPINTLGAVNKFLENNVPARKNVQISGDSTGEPTKVRLGPHARRRANKRVVVVQESPANAEGADEVISLEQ